MKKICLLVFVLVTIYACKKDSSTKFIARPFIMKAASLNGASLTTGIQYAVSLKPTLTISFSGPLNTATTTTSIFLAGSGSVVPCIFTFSNNDSTVTLVPKDNLIPLTQYIVYNLPGFKSNQDSALKGAIDLNFITQLDSTDKFARISDSALLTLVQQQTFNYFWAFGHPNCGMSRERTSSGDVVTTGGSGFGVMAMLVGVQRGFITRSQALTRIDTIVSFLTNKVTRYHGAFAHWNNGVTGATVPFGTYDNGADIVETSYMIQGLLCARQFFNSTTDPNEINLRNNINNIYNAVEWNWFRQNGQNVLTWNWSPNNGWYINVHVQGWCEALITYVLAASSPVDSNRIPSVVYTNGWAQNGAMKNGGSYLGVTLPLGPSYGGPLFFAHYSFLGINPTGLSDAYANYWVQDTAHATINYLYCVNNPNHYNGYSSACWGLTASDVSGGYNASSPTSDMGVIAPTAAVSSLPYTPVQSMNAIRFFYYKLGNKIWGQYGFIDAFNLSNIWYDSDCLAIDQGPQIIMIENYRTGLLWNLFMSCPEVKTGMKSLGFQSPNL